MPLSSVVCRKCTPLALTPPECMESCVAPSVFENVPFEVCENTSRHFMKEKKKTNVKS
eukprot:m.159623 g.159623  ORF g.159623 m.159623 type:complete len:58 (-) comp20914_c0_seq4:341-514(-)